MKKINIKDLEGLSKEDVLGMVEIKKQVPVVKKIEAAEVIVNNLVKLQDDGTYGYDSVAKMISEVIVMVQLYTNVELTDDTYLNYDIITGVKLDEIIDEYSDSSNLIVIIDNKIWDVMKKNSVQHIFARSMDSMYGTLDTIAEHVNNMLDKGDPNKVAKYLSKGIEMLAKKMPDFSVLDIQKQLEAQLNRKKMN